MSSRTDSYEVQRILLKSFDPDRSLLGHTCPESSSSQKSVRVRVLTSSEPDFT